MLIITDSDNPEIAKLATALLMDGDVSEAEVTSEIAKVTLIANALQLGIPVNSTAEQVATAYVNALSRHYRQAMVQPAHEIEYYKTEKTYFNEIFIRKLNDIDASYQSRPNDVVALYTPEEVRAALLDDRTATRSFDGIALDVSKALFWRSLGDKFPGIDVLFANARNMPARFSGEVGRFGIDEPEFPDLKKNYIAYRTEPKSLELNNPLPETDPNRYRIKPLIQLEENTFPPEIPYSNGTRDLIRFEGDWGTDKVEPLRDDKLFISDPHKVPTLPTKIETTLDPETWMRETYPALFNDEPHLDLVSDLDSKIELIDPPFLKLEKFNEYRIESHLPEPTDPSDDSAGIDPLGL